MRGHLSPLPALSLGFVFPPPTALFLPSHLRQCKCRAALPLLDISFGAREMVRSIAHHPRSGSSHVPNRFEVLRHYIHGVPPVLRCSSIDRNAWMGYKHMGIEIDQVLTYSSSSDEKEEKWTPAQRVFVCAQSRTRDHHRTFSASISPFWKIYDYSCTRPPPNSQAMHHG